MKPGENLEAAARRETHEECTLQLDDLDFVGYVTYGKPVRRLHCFIGRVGPKDEPMPAGEIMEAKFVEVGRAKTLIQPAQRPLLEWIPAAFKAA